MKINNNKIKSLFLLSLVGSSLAKEEKPDNQTEITHSNEISFNSLPEMGTNFTHGKVTKRDNPKQNVLMAGSRIAIAEKWTDETTWINCTGSFVIVNSNTTDDGCNYGNDYGGFLTTLFCHPPLTDVAPQPPVTNWDGSVSLGNIFYETTFTGDVPYPDWKAIGEFLYISANLANVKLLPFVPKTTDKGTTDFLPVIASSNPTAPGLSVCVYGAVSGYRCGHIIEVGAIVIAPVPTLGGHLSLANLTKVNLGNKGLITGDFGAPVYSETQIGERTLAEALGHVSWIDNEAYQNQFFYYMPLEYALDMIKSDYSCAYSLLTYNETNAQEYDQLLAQVEISAKN